MVLMVCCFLEVRRSFFGYSVGRGIIGSVYIFILLVFLIFRLFVGCLFLILILKFYFIL